MNLITDTVGQAREYAPLALRIYNKCDLNCSGCQHQPDDELVLPGDVKPVKDFRRRLQAELARQSITRQVLVGFPGDPYCYADTRMFEHTRYALDQLHAYQVPVAILTKVGKPVMRDMNRFTTMYCKVGARLSFDNPMDSLTYEPGGTVPANRITLLERLKTAGVRTWASLEMIHDPLQTLALIDRTHEFVDEYRVCISNYIRNEQSIDWRRIVGDVVDRLRGYGKPFYLANSLQCFAYGLTDTEKDPDHLTLAMETANCA